MSLKLLVSDMDGTLLQSDSALSSTTKEALVSLQKNGVRIILASGRPKARMISYAQELQLDKYGGFLIESNGSAIYDFKEDRYDVIRSMSKEELSTLFADLKQHCPTQEIFFMSDHAAYVYNPNNEKVSQYFHVDHVEASKNREIIFIDSIEELDCPIVKVCLYRDPEAIKRMVKNFSYMKDRFFIGIVMPYWLEINPIDMSKGNALQKVMDHLSVDKEDVIAFGDAENDISMLTLVKGVAMGNAIESVKEKCYYHTVKNTDEGVVKFLLENGYITQ